MKKKLANLLSLLVSLSLIGSNIVSASYIVKNNLNDGIITDTLTKNEELTKENFIDNPNGYIVKNGIRNIEVMINNNNNTLTLSEDLNICLNGEITFSNNIGEYTGVFEGMLSSDVPIIVSAVYTEMNIFLTITIGYLGDIEMETAYFGIYNDKMNDITNKSFSNVSVTDDLELSNVENYNNIDIARTTNAEIDVQYTEVNTVNGYSVARFTVYHQDELQNGGKAGVYVKINTQSNSLQTYLKNNVYTNADYVYAMPDTFDFSITGLSSKFIIQSLDYEPKSSTSTFELTIPIYYDGKFIVVQIPGEAGRCDATLSSTYSSSIPNTGNKVTWNMYYSYGWNTEKYDGDHTTQSGNGVYVNIGYNSDTLPTFAQSIRSTGKVRYIVRTITGEESESPINYYPSKSFVKTTSIGIVQ